MRSHSLSTGFPGAPLRARAGRLRPLQAARTSWRNGQARVRAAVQRSTDLGCAAVSWSAHLGCPADHSLPDLPACSEARERAAGDQPAALIAGPSVGRWNATTAVLGRFVVPEGTSGVTVPERETAPGLSQGGRR
ncbi:hypothetical protein [Amycolatopsis magusensis]|uniref:hypothetical protein n=1 Tax=Amycolatopsis magusensis TaxID=882444 RepID=UPI0037B816C5